MWPDNETGTDFLNFSGVAETVGEIVVQARGRPISIGVSGAWGAGKSSMIKLIRHGLENRPEGQAGNFVFVEFNAWLYQGYDDARAALLEAIASTLAHEAQERKTGVDKAQGAARPRKLASGGKTHCKFRIGPLTWITSSRPDRRSLPARQPNADRRGRSRDDCRRRKDCRESWQGNRRTVQTQT